MRLKGPSSAGRACSLTKESVKRMAASKPNCAVTGATMRPAFSLAGPANCCDHWRIDLDNGLLELILIAASSDPLRLMPQG
eukprot:6307682-Alexandrium_andersonii.AAC.1